MKAFCDGRGVYFGVAVIVFTWMVFISGCATSKVIESKGPESPLSLEKKKITEVQLTENDHEALIQVVGDQKLIFTSVKQSTPPTIVFYFPDTVIDVKEPVVPSNAAGVVKDIELTELTETGHTTRMELSLSLDAPYTVKSNERGLDILVRTRDAKLITESEKVTEPEKAVISDSKEDAAIPEKDLNSISSLSQKATELLSLETRSLSGATQIMIHLNGSIDQYKSFTLTNPPRIVFDLPNIKAAANVEEQIDVKALGVERIRHYFDSQKLRLVLETQREFLNSFTSMPNTSGLLINVGTHAVGNSAVLREIASGKIEHGNFEVKVSTSKRVAYQIKRITPRWLRLSLLNCGIPDGQQVTPKGVNSPSGLVTAIDAVSDPKQPKDTHVDIRLNDTVPYHVRQDNEQLYVKFEAATEKTEKISVKAGISKTATMIVNTSEIKNTTKAKSAKSSTKIGPKYTGEKIALDFYNTDIHNVFRILADISGENFAIDKDVEGKVTLSLDKPVPWDQVLDLVLRMNQLDQQKDDNIIRIATQKTLKAEDDARIAQIKAKRAEEEQADVQTEYILINYADASKDVKPHLEAILSDNGKLSVDTRNNLLILTDVPTVIARAKEIVNEIDNATPQVLIEARIVEADNSFSREIGLSWNAAWGIQSDDPRAGIGPQRGFDRFGGTYGYDTAVNFPFSIGSPMELGFNIARVAGTPFGLDARLRLLEINGNGRVVSAPKVLTLDSQEAVITQGQEYPYFEESESGGRTVKFKKVELKLVVTPHITPDGRVSIHIKIEKKDVFSFVEGVPILNTKEAETEFLMNDQDTLVIGGIHKTTERLSQQGYPWLSKIPFLGWLFKTQNKELDKEELLIFISPKIRKMERRNLNRDLKDPTIGKTIKGSLG